MTDPHSAREEKPTLSLPLASEAVPALAGALAKARVGKKTKFAFKPKPRAPKSGRRGKATPSLGKGAAALAAAPSKGAAVPTAGSSPSLPASTATPVLGHPLPTPSASKTPKEGYLLATDRWAPEVVSDSSADKYLRKMGFVPRYPGSGVVHNDTNMHPAQAAERSIATARALGFLYARGIRDVTTVYGNPRDERINDFCNGQVANAGDKLRLVRYSPIVAAKDFTRTPTTITYGDAVAKAESLLLVDIYETNINIGLPWSPQAAAAMLSSIPHPIGGNRILWVGRKFYGNAGLVCGEGGWYRDDKDKIHYRSSMWEPVEYAHDPCDWMWTGSQASITVRGQELTLSWTIVKVVGTFYLVSFNVTPGRLADPGAGNPLFPFDEQIITVKCPKQNHWASYWSPIASYLPEFLRSRNPFLTTIKVYRPQYEAGRKEMLAKRYNQTNFARVNSAMMAQEKNPETALFFRLFPHFLLGTNFNAAAWGVMLDDINERAISNTIASGVDGFSMASVNATQSSIGVPPSPRFEWMPSKLKILSGLAVIGTTLIVIRKAAHVIKTLDRIAAQRVPRVPFTMIPGPLSGSSRVFWWPYNLLLPSIRPRNEFGYGTVTGLVVGYCLESLVIPFYEELLKRLMSWLKLGWVLPVYEFLSFVIAAREGRVPFSVRDAVILRCFPFAMHMVANRLSFTKGFLLHAVWNFLIGRIIHYLLVESGLLPNARLAACTMMGSFFQHVRTRVVCASLLGAGGIFLTIWTIRSLLKRRVDQYLLWKQKYFLSPWDEREVYDDPRSFSCPVTDPQVPEQVSELAIPDDAANDMQYQVKLDPPSHFLSVDGIMPPEVPRPETFFWHILPTCAPGFVPKTCSYNLEVAVAHRVLKAPPLDPKIQEEQWRTSTALYGDEILETLQGNGSYSPPWDSIVDNWVAHFDDLKKRKLYSHTVSALKQDVLDFQAPKTTDLFVKHDEMLMQQKDGMYVLKPRIIANVEPSFQARVGPYVLEAQKRLKSQWSVDTPAICWDHTGHGSLVYYHFMTGGGASDHELSEWMYRVLHREYIPDGEFGFCFLVCGDDSVVAMCMSNGQIIFFEGDASMFDQSESRGPLKWEYRVLNRLGLDGQVTNALYRAASNTYRVKPGKKDGDQFCFFIGRQARAMRDTGGADTYVGNTIVMLSAWYFVVRHLMESGQHHFFLMDPLAAIREEFATLGFDMKLNMTENPTAVTFLKGMWYDCGRLCWGPLPSRILKMGKSMKDPRTLYSEKDMVKAGAMYLRDVASSYKPFLQVPVVRAFVARYRDDGYIPSPMNPCRLPNYAISASGALKDIQLDLTGCAAACARYNLTQEEIDRAEKMISESKPFTFLHDPVFLKLAAVDYA